MPESKESKIERIAKNIVGMGYLTSTVEYDEINDVRPTVTNFIENIRNYVANLSFNGTKITLQKHFSQVIPRFNVKFTHKVTDRTTGVENTVSQTTRVSIMLLADMTYEVEGSLKLSENELSANKTYNGTLYAEMKPNIRLRPKDLPATTPDPICNVELSSGVANKVIMDDSDSLIETWLAEVEVALQNKFRNNAHTRPTP